MDGLTVANNWQDDLKRKIMAARAAGWNENDISHYATKDIMQNQTAQSSNNQSQAPAKKNGWANWLPVAGGVVGGILGTPLDLISGPGGNIAGASVGSALGNFLKQRFQGDKGSLIDQAKSDILAGAGGAVGEGGGRVATAVGGKVLSKVAPEAYNFLTRSGTNAATDQTAKQSFLNKFIKSQQPSTAKVAGQTVEDLRTGVRTGLKPEGASHALTPSEVARIKDTIASTGAKGSATSKAATVENAKNTAGQALKDTIDANNKDLQLTTTASDHKDIIKSLGERINGADGQAIIGNNPGLVPEYTDFVKRLLNVTDVKGLVNLKRSYQSAVNFGRSDALGEPWKQAFHDAVQKTLNDKIGQLAPSVADASSVFSKLSNAQNALVKASTNSGGRLPSSFKDIFRTAGSPVEKTLKVAGAVGSAPVTRGAVRQTIGQSLFGDKGQPAQPGQPQADSSQFDPFSEFGIKPDMSVIADSTDSASPDAGSGSSGGTDSLQYSSTQLLNAAMQAMNAGDSKTAAALSTMAGQASALEKQQLASQPSVKLSAAQQLRHDALESALASLDSAGTNLETAGGAKGLRGEAGKLPWLGKFLDPSGAAYTNTKIEMATALAKAVTGGARPGQEVIAKYMHSLPDINDPPAYAQAKLDKLRAEMNAQSKRFGYTDLLDNTAQNPDQVNQSAFDPFSSFSYAQ